MKSRFEFSGTVIFAALLASILALATAATPQTPDTSTASLQDTLTWLSNYLPSATGETYSDGGVPITITTQISGWNGCTITLVITTVDSPTTLNGGSTVAGGTFTQRDVFSLSDIDSNSVKVDTQAGIWVLMNSSTNSIQETYRHSDGTNSQSMKTLTGAASFNDQSGAERAANAFRHAVNLCAKSQPF
jgi:hypothetical protein